MILITSGAYVNPGLQVEFGKLPPCMLPVMNKRLYEHQINLFGKEENIYITLPLDYELNVYDLRNMEMNGIKVVRVPNDLSLGASIVYSLSRIGRLNEPLRLLHGDTLVGPIPSDLDLYSVSAPLDDYNWNFSNNASHEDVLTGYFAFSSSQLLLEAIRQNDSDFILGLRSYQQEVEILLYKTHYWNDFGLRSTYYRSKSKMTTQRVFNDLEISDHAVKKCSSDNIKLAAEANWYKEIPSALRRYTPKLYDEGYTIDGKSFYEIEYLHLPTISELFVFGSNSSFMWQNIINSCFKYLALSSRYKPDNIEVISENSMRLYGEKTKKRLSLFCAENNLYTSQPLSINGVVTPSLDSILSEVTQLIAKPSEDIIGVLHGDLCFSNLLFDFTSQDIKVIDPRGLDSDMNNNIYGDLRYDIAKLGHSILGMYDFIIAGRYDYKCSKDNEHELDFWFDESVYRIQQLFLETKFNG